MDEETAPEFESALSRLGVRAAVHRTLRLLRRNVSADSLARALLEQEAKEKMEGAGPSGRRLAQRAGTEGWRHGESPPERPELPLPTREERAQAGQRRQSVFGMNSRRKLKAFMTQSQEEEENRKAGRVPLTGVPQQQAGRESNRMQWTQQPKKERDSLSFPETTSNTEEGLQTAEAWTRARRQFRAELESLGDLEKWLAHKPSLSRQEERCWQRIKADRANRGVAAESAVIDSLEHFPSKSSQPQKKATIPLIRAPYPEALVTLHNLLHKKKLKMVDVFKKAAIDRMKIKRRDFIQVIKETKVPISDKDLEDVVIFLMSSKPGNCISLDDLMDCQKQWLEMRQGKSQEAKTGVGAQFRKDVSKTATCPASAADAHKGMKPHPPTEPKRKLIHLEVSPADTKPEMEEMGKLSRERRRWKKNTDSPIGPKEKGRKARSGDGPVEKHCLPSTIEGDLGELVDRYRRNAVTTYQMSSELCQERGVHITDSTLQKGLLHPGDRIIKEGDNIMKIRQPGGYYSTGCTDAASSGSTSRSGSTSGSRDKKAKTRHLEGSKMQKSDDNKFWPGHLLDKLCLYFPEKQHDRAHALFSYVPPTKPVYRGF